MIPKMEVGGCFRQDGKQTELPQLTGSKNRLFDVERTHLFLFPNESFFMDNYFL